MEQGGARQREGKERRKGGKGMQERERARKEIEREKGQWRERRGGKMGNGGRGEERRERRGEVEYLGLFG